MDVKKLLFTSSLVAVSAASVLAEEASKPVTLPETGVNISGFIGTAITALGSIVAVAVGGYIAFLLVRKGLRWVRTALN